MREYEVIVTVFTTRQAIFKVQVEDDERSPAAEHAARVMFERGEIKEWEEEEPSVSIAAVFNCPCDHT